MTPKPPRGRLGLRWLQFVGLATVALSIGLLSVSLPFRLQELSTVCVEGCAGGQLHPSEAAALAQFGLSLPAYALYSLGLYVFFGGVCWGLAAVLVARRANDSPALLAALTLIAMGTTSGLSGTTLPGGWDYVLVVVLLVWYTTIVNLLYSFPDGRFIPGWARWVSLVWIVWFVAGLAYVLSTGQDPPPLFWALLTGLMFGIIVLGVAAQIYRYRRLSTPAQRQQTKWVVVGFALYITSELLYLAFNEGLRPALGLPAGGLAEDLLYPLLDVASLLLIPVSIGAAVLRYRLWDIDLVIRRTLLYSALTGLLALAYFVSVTVLQYATAVVTGERQSALVTVLSTLLIAALFAPVRAGVQRFIDRRFFRRRYDAARALADFAETLRDDVNLEELSHDLLTAVESSMQPEHATLWVRTTEKA